LAKVRISEQNAKEKQLFILLFSNESIFSQSEKLRISEQRAKGKFIFLCSFEQKIANAKGKREQSGG